METARAEQTVAFGAIGRSEADGGTSDSDGGAVGTGLNGPGVGVSIVETFLQAGWKRFDRGSDEGRVHGRQVGTGHGFTCSATHRASAVGETAETDMPAFAARWAIIVL